MADGLPIYNGIAYETHCPGCGVMYLSRVDREARDDERCAKCLRAQVEAANVYRERAHHIVRWLRAQANAEYRLEKLGRELPPATAREVFVEAHNTALAIYDGKHDATVNGGEDG